MDWTLPENLKKLKEMAEQATSGPWTVRRADAPKPMAYRYILGDNLVVAGAYGGDMLAEPNGLFIAAAREALPQLIAALEKEQMR